MSQTSTPTRRPKRPKTRQTPPAAAAVLEVLTLEEAAAYLRVSQQEVEDLATRCVLPGRQIGDQWRFLKTALANWLGAPVQKGFWQTQFGALKDDPFVDEMLRDIYRQRGRSMTEEE